MDQCIVLRPKNQGSADSPQICFCVYELIYSFLPHAHVDSSSRCPFRRSGWIINSQSLECMDGQSHVCPLGICGSCIVSNFASGFNVGFGLSVVRAVVDEPLEPSTLITFKTFKLNMRNARLDKSTTLPVSLTFFTRLISRRCQPWLSVAAAWQWIHQHPIALLTQR
jgi:hypothetical protein